MPRVTSIDADNDFTIKRTDFKSFRFNNTKNREHSIGPMAQGYSTLASNIDKHNDDFGLTNPNLHRRIEQPTETTTADDTRNQELLPHKYKIFVANVHSYLNTEYYYHSEESVDNENP